jgi:hypothetical protein
MSLMRAVIAVGLLVTLAGCVVAPDPYPAYGYGYGYGYDPGYYRSPAYVAGPTIAVGGGWGWGHRRWRDW